MYQIINDQLIRRIEDGACIPVADGNTDYLAYRAWIADGNTPLPPDRPTDEQLAAIIVGQIQQRLDAFAQTRGYDNMLSACTYATSSVPKFKSEGQYCVDARDATWAKTYEMLDEVQAGAHPLPGSIADIEVELPALAWPA